MKRDELERKIAEASDGELTPAEIVALEQELESWPDLQKDYAALASLPDFHQAYPIENKRKFSTQIHEIYRKIGEQNQKNDHFSELSLLIFKKYALAASILIMAGSSALFLSDAARLNPQDSVATDEFVLYQIEGSASDNYMVEIDNLLLDGNSDEY